MTINDWHSAVKKPGDNMRSVPELKKNSLKQLSNLGQSVWLDYIRRDLIDSGELKRMVNDDGLYGMTSNPAIFEKAIAGSNDYATSLKELSKKKELKPKGIYESLAIKDIQDAADILLNKYQETSSRDGYVSLEVSPLLASDTKATIDEAKRLWKLVNRKNLMVKVPGTKEGIPAIRELIASGININVTLLFSQAVYEQVADAYIAGLEDLAKAGGNLSKVSSVASFFVSRIDNSVDSMLEKKLHDTIDPNEKDLIESIMGKVAIANAKLAYQYYLEMIKSPRWQALATKGAKSQRLLWASTSTKNPKYKDTLYVEELIGKDTVNTIPPETLSAFMDHGQARESLTEGIGEAKNVLDNLKKLGISLDQITNILVDQGVKLFADAFNKLINTISEQGSLGKSTDKQNNINHIAYKLPKELNEALEATLKDWQTNDKVKKLWNKDASLWTNTDENKWLDWLNIVQYQISQLNQFRAAADDIQACGFTHALLLGMGGSSLCPEVMSKTFGKVKPYPQLHILDSTDPAQITARENEIDIKKTIFIVSSKSGTTLEPNIYKQYFFKKTQEAIGKNEVGDRFVAITDPDSKLESVAKADKFRYIFHGVPGIGGRYSALSNFGVVPSAIMGIDLAKFLAEAEKMVQACSNEKEVKQNPGVLLGAIMGTLAKAKRDKVTFITTPQIHDLGAWLEQLIAESTGKDGKGLIPVDREEIGEPNVYGKDRLFVYLRLESAFDSKQDEKVALLEQADEPVIKISIPNIYCLGQEYFRWEIATAVAGSIIGINAFNQPDVEASKIATRNLTNEYEKTGSLPKESPLFEDGEIQLFTDDKNTSELNKLVGQNKTLAAYIQAHLSRIKTDDYFALLAYIEMNDNHEKQLQVLRHFVRNKYKIATCLGFGPRFLHSTGQAYKGGPNTGVFLQITADDIHDIVVPEQKYTFGIVKAAQARGDFEVLAQRNRRALRIHLGKNIVKSLATLTSLFK